MPISGGVNIFGSSTKSSIFRCNVSTEGEAANGCQFWVESYSGSSTQTCGRVCVSVLLYIYCVYIHNIQVPISYSVFRVNVPT